MLEPQTRRLQRVEGTRAVSGVPARVPSAPAPNAILLGVLWCLPTVPALLLGENGDFGMSPIYGQLLDKPLLAFAHSHGVLDVEHNRDREIKRRAPSCRPARVSDRQFLDFRSWIGGFSAPVSARRFPISVSAWPRPVRYATEPGLQSRVSRVTRDVGMKSAASKTLLL